MIIRGEMMGIYRERVQRENGKKSLSFSSEEK